MSLATVKFELKILDIKSGLRFKSKTNPHNNFTFEVVRLDTQTKANIKGGIKVTDIVIVKEDNSNIEIPTSLDGAKACFRQKIWVPIN